MATSRTGTTRTTKPRTRRTKPKLETTIARAATRTTKQASDYATRIKDYATEHPWISAAAGVGAVAVAWSARRLWLPIAAAAALDRLIPKTGDALTIEGIQRHWKSMKPSFLS